MTLEDNGFISIGDERLEYRMIGPRPDAAPTIVMLHEGLGSVTTWAISRKSLPRRPASACSSIRAAATASRPPSRCRARSTILQREATTVLPKLLDVIGFRRGI